MARFLPTTLAEVLDLTKDMEIGEEFRATISREDFESWEEFLNEDLPFGHVLIPYRWRKYFVNVLVTKDIPTFLIYPGGIVEHSFSRLDGTIRDEL